SLSSAAPTALRAALICLMRSSTVFIWPSFSTGVPSSQFSASLSASPNGARASSIGFGGLFERCGAFMALSSIGDFVAAEVGGREFCLAGVLRRNHGWHGLHGAGKVFPDRRKGL